MSKCPICNSEAASHSPGGLDGEEGLLMPVGGLDSIKMCLLLQMMLE